MEKGYILNIDEIREREYSSLTKTTYLDHAGTTLYSRSLIQNFSKDMSSNLFGNPHSASPSSALSTDRTERVRRRVLKFLKADPEYFDVIFVANATAAIKMVMHAFQDYSSTGSSEPSGGFWYGYHCDAHTSLVGIREVASGGTRCFTSDSEVENWLQNKPDPANAGYNRQNGSKLGLFAYPAQSNLNGHRPPLNWSGRIRASLHAMHHNLYKIFGFPDLGALVVRKAAGHILRQRHYFGGGTVDMVIALDAPWHAKKSNELHEELEDGTLPFHNIIALDSAFDAHEHLFGSMTRVSAHASYLAKTLYTDLTLLRHGNGAAVCEIYKHPNSTYGDSKSQGPTLAFNIRNSHGGWVGKSDVEKLAIVRGIQLRTGGVCNPGGIATMLKLRSWELRRNFAEGMRCGDDFDILAGKPTGVVRVSLGAMSSMKDIETFVRFVRELFVEPCPRPIEFSEQHTDLVTSLRVESITVFPVTGCKGWQVPSEMSWEINEDGLAWDGEWCIYDMESDEPLTAENHPGMQFLQPSLQLEEGILTITIDGATTRSSNTVNEVTVSLWETPSDHSRSCATDPSRPEVYHSTSLTEFFTLYLGYPCSLARYPHHRMVDKSIPPVLNIQALAKISNGLPQKSISISMLAAGSSNLNINLTSRDPTWHSNASIESWLHLRIGPHYFQNLQPLSTSTHHEIHYLPNRTDFSLAAQYPTLSVGQQVQSFSATTSANDPILQACIASQALPTFLCPVHSCRTSHSTRKALNRHFSTHAETIPAAPPNRENNEDDTSSEWDATKIHVIGEGKDQSGNNGASEAPRASRPVLRKKTRVVSGPCLFREGKE